jgi:antitoxin MazE6
MRVVPQREWPARPDAARIVLSTFPPVADRYDPVILRGVKTAISVPDDTFRRVDHAAKRLGVSRSEFFSRAAEQALDALEDDGTTDAINRAIAGLPADHAFTDAAAAALAAGDQR